MHSLAKLYYFYDLAGFDLTKNDVGSSIEPDQDYLFSPLRGIYSLDKGEIESSFKGQHLLDFMSGKFSNNMTKKVITIQKNQSTNHAKRLLHENRIEKLVVIDNQKRCIGHHR